LLIAAMHPGADFRGQRHALLHFPLRFGGEDARPVAEDLATALRGLRAEPFAARVAGVGRFEQRNSGALWAGVEPKALLAALAAKVERICQSVGLEPERRAFHPHITLARWKGRRAREVANFLDGARGLSSEPFAVDRVILFESRLSRHGPHYEEVAEYPLG
jgi:2'-5' RNA ligase